MTSSLEKSKRRCIFQSILQQDHSIIQRISPDQLFLLLLEVFTENQTSTAFNGDCTLVAISTFIFLLEKPVGKLNHGETLQSLPSSTKYLKKDISYLSSNTERQPEFADEEKNEMIDHSWYAHAIKLITGSNIVYYLMQILKNSSCKFSQFLVRKAIRSGVANAHFKIDDILRLIETQLLSQSKTSLSTLDLLEDILVCALKDPSCSDHIYTWMRDLYEFSFSEDHFKDQEFCYRQKCMMIFEKLVKLVVLHYVEVKDLRFVASIFERLVFPSIQHIPQMCDKNMQSQYCLQLIKTLDSFINDEWLRNKSVVPQEAMTIIKTFQPHAFSLFEILLDNDFHKNVSFIGVKTKHSRPCSEQDTTCSNLMRRFIIIILKSCAILVKDNNKTQESISLVCLFQNIVKLTSKSDKVNQENWLSSQFADQDNHWIFALLCLIVIFNCFRKMHSDMTMMAALPTENRQSLEEFVHHFCPHRLFLQFVKFLDYDHLVLSDFLISPETVFLPYFLQYLHYMFDNWTEFKIAFGTKPTPDSISEHPNSPTCNSSMTEVLDCTSTHSVLRNSDLQKSCITESKLSQLVNYSDSDSDSTDGSSQDWVENGLASNNTDKVGDLNCGSPYADTGLVLEDSKLDTIMGMLIRLRLHVSRLDEKGLFLYNIKPLINLIERVEEMYDVT